MKTGILGGTFDPVHNGHLAIAGCAREKLGLDRVIFIPSNRTPLKERDDISSEKHRREMLRLATNHDAAYEISDIELRRPGISYTVDTVLQLRKDLNQDDELYFIVGWDSFNDLPKWKEAGKLIKLCKLVSLTRPGTEKPDLAELDKEIPGLSRNVIIIDMQPVDLSSTEIRKRIMQDLPVHGMVPETVEKYINENGLYR
jgi:nicotinate-nucleotide adenylyltransferase